MPLALAARYTTIGEAAAARSVLEAAGIETFLENANMVAVDWVMANAVGWIKVLVREEDLDEAREVLAGPVPLPDARCPLPDQRFPGSEQRAAGSDVSCPECGSTDVQLTPRLRVFALFTCITLGLGYAFGQFQFALAGLFAVAILLLLVPSHQCRECTHRWTPDAGENDAPLPDARDLVERTCPRCGSPELVKLRYRKLKVLPMLMSFMILIVAPVYLALPKWQCENCGLRS